MDRKIQFREAFLAEIKAPLSENVPLSAMSSFGIGGPADLFFEARSEVDLEKAMSLAVREKYPFYVIGGGTNTLSFTWNGISAQQSVTVDLGSSGQFDGVAMLGNVATVAAVDQDGYGVGTLLNAGFNNNGELVGYYSNGQSQVLEQLRISMFSNEGGLLRSGDTLFVESPNSDDAIATTANSAGAGSVRSGQLENSNVDIAQEFVDLIEAQRGFQANSRVITTTDEILAELMNIVR